MNVFPSVPLALSLWMESVWLVIKIVLNVPIQLPSVPHALMDLFLMQLVEDANLLMYVHLVDTRMPLVNARKSVLLEATSSIQLATSINVLLDTKSNKSTEHALKILLPQAALVLNSFKEEYVWMYVLQDSILTQQQVSVKVVHQVAIVAWVLKNVKHALLDLPSWIKNVLAVTNVLTIWSNIKMFVWLSAPLVPSTEKDFAWENAQQEQGKWTSVAILLAHRWVPPMPVWQHAQPVSHKMEQSVW